MSEKIERRDFLKNGAAGIALTAGGLHAAGARAHAQTLTAATGERIVVALIGTGRQGRGLLNDFVRQPDVEVAALCDVYAPNLAAATALAPRAEKVIDFRRILDRQDVNAVVIAAPDHWHAPMTVMACQAGKDVYVEKPIATSVEEGRRMVRAARKYDRVVQVGTQQRSSLHFQKVVELIRGGRIGKISYVRTWNYGNEYPQGIGNPPDGAPPSDLDWEMWLGPAPKVPFNANRFGVAPDRWSSFRWFWDYAGGMMTDWGVHLLDIVQWAMNVDHPQVVSASGGKFFLQDNRETPDTLQVTYEYPSFVCTYENRECNAHALNGQGYGIMFHGTDGTLFVNRGGYEIILEKRRENNAEAVKEKVSDTGGAHVRNFLDCVKSRQKPICDIEIGHRSTSTALLGNVAYRSHRRVVWDGKTEQVVGDKAASKFLSREYRKPWSLDV
jgi:predicted dehydrogenase